MKIRGFEPISKYLEEGVNDQIILGDAISEYPIIKGKGLIFKDDGTSNEFKMPARATSGAAGYDIFNNTGETIVINPGETVKITTYIKSYMQADEVLSLYPRSGHGFKYLVRLANTVGIVDCVPAGTLIRTNKGDIPVEHLVQKNPDISIISYDEESHATVEDSLTDIWTVDDLELLTIETEDGTTITVPTTKEVFTRRGWVAAKELAESDEILSID